jgi:hypothetical protein
MLHERQITKRVPIADLRSGRRHSAKRPGDKQGISVFIKETSEEANGENDERLCER